MRSHWLVVDPAGLPGRRTPNTFEYDKCKRYYLTLALN